MSMQVVREQAGEARQGKAAPSLSQCSKLSYYPDTNAPRRSHYIQHVQQVWCASICNDGYPYIYVIPVAAGWYTRCVQPRGILRICDKFIGINDQLRGRECGEAASHLRLRAPDCESCCRQKRGEIELN